MVTNLKRVISINFPKHFVTKTVITMARETLIVKVIEIVTRTEKVRQVKRLLLESS